MVTKSEQSNECGAQGTCLWRSFCAKAAPSGRLSAHRFGRRRATAGARGPSRGAAGEAVATAAAGNAQEESLQFFIDTQAVRRLIERGIRFDLPPFALHAQTPFRFTRHHCKPLDERLARRAGRLDGRTTSTAASCWQREEPRGPAAA